MPRLARERVPDLVAQFREQFEDELDAPPIGLRLWPSDSPADLETWFRDKQSDLASRAPARTHRKFSNRLPSRGTGESLMTATAEALLDGALTFDAVRDYCGKSRANDVCRLAWNIDARERAEAGETLLDGHIKVLGETHWDDLSFLIADGLRRLGWHNFVTDDRVRICLVETVQAESGHPACRVYFRRPGGRWVPEWVETAEEFKQALHRRD